MSTLQLKTIQPMVEKVITLKNKLHKEEYNIELINEIAETYLLMDNKNGALKYIQMALQSDPFNRKALEMENKLK